MERMVKIRSMAKSRGVSPPLARKRASQGTLITPRVVKRKRGPSQTVPCAPKAVKRKRVSKARGKQSSSSSPPESPPVLDDEETSNGEDIIEETDDEQGETSPVKREQVSPMRAMEEGDYPPLSTAVKREDTATIGAILAPHDEDCEGNPDKHIQAEEEGEYSASNFLFEEEEW